jgi:hypothetical protein
MEPSDNHPTSPTDGPLHRGVRVNKKLIEVDRPTRLRVPRATTTARRQPEAETLAPRTAPRIRLCTP